MPAEKPRSYDCELVEILELSTTVKHFVLKYSSDANLNFIAGQFLMIHLEKDGKPHKKSYSIASSPNLAIKEHKIELSIKFVEGGFVSTWFFDLKVGAKMKTSIPYGVFSLKQMHLKDLVFVGTGTGVAPLRSMIQIIDEEKLDKNMTLIFGNRYDTDILYQNEWENLVKTNPNFTFIPTVSRSKDWKGEKDYVQVITKKLYEGKIEGKEFFGCGLGPMCKALKQTLIDIGVPKENYHFELFI